jgi:cAMP-dependent protein kinase regulator
MCCSLHPTSGYFYYSLYLKDKFPEETAEFKVPEIGKPPNLILAPHNDDEQLSETESDHSSVDTNVTATSSINEQPPHRKKRRESIFAEKIDVEADFQLTNIEKNELESSRILQILKSNLFFSHLDENQLNQVVNAMFLVEKKERDIIINQGDDGDNFYIIDSGSVQVLIKTIGSSEEVRLVKTCDAGDSFGELAIMYNAPRAVSRCFIFIICFDVLINIYLSSRLTQASCIAKTKVRLWALDRVAFKMILMKTTRAQRETYRGFLKSVEVFSELKE